MKKNNYIRNNIHNNILNNILIAAFGFSSVVGHATFHPYEADRNARRLAQPNFALPAGLRSSSISEAPYQIIFHTVDLGVVAQPGKIYGNYGIYSKRKGLKCASVKKAYASTRNLTVEFYDEGDSEQEVIKIDPKLAQFYFYLRDHAVAQMSQSIRASQYGDVAELDALICFASAWGEKIASISYLEFRLGHGVKATQRLRDNQEFEAQKAQSIRAGTWNIGMALRGAHRNSEVIGFEDSQKILRSMAFALTK